MAFDLVDSLVTFVLDNLPQLLELAAQLILALVQGITENLPKIAEGAGELIPKIIATVVDKLPEIIDTGFEITVELVKGIAEDSRERCTAHRLDVHQVHRVRLAQSRQEPDTRYQGRRCAVCI